MDSKRAYHLKSRLGVIRDVVQDTYSEVSRLRFDGEPAVDAKDLDEFDQTVKQTIEGLDAMIQSLDRICFSLYAYYESEV